MVLLQTVSMKKLSYLLVIIVAALYACDSDPEPTLTSNSYMPLKVGNYWVYKTYNTDSSNYNPSNLTYIQDDSIYVDRFEILQGDTFYVLKGIPPHMYGEYNINGETYLRDSLGFIITIDHKILFAPIEGDAAVILYKNYTVNQGDTTNFYFDVLEHLGDSSLTSPENSMHMVHQISRYYYAEYDTFLTNPYNYQKIFSHYYTPNIGMVCDYEGGSWYSFLSRFHVE